MDLGGIEARLRSSGLRVTRPRTAVLLVLERAGAGQHLTVADVVGRTREMVAGISPQTVYRCLDALVCGGIARRVDLPGSPALFELARGDHEHLVCARCGAVVNVSRSGPSDLGLTDPHGSRVVQTDAVFHGLCAACAGS